MGPPRGDGPDGRAPAAQAAGIAAALAGLAVNGAFDAAKMDLKALKFLQRELLTFYIAADNYENMSVRIGTVLELYQVEKCGNRWPCRQTESYLYVDWDFPHKPGPPLARHKISYNMLNILYEHVGLPKFERYFCRMGDEHIYCQYHSTIPDYDGPGAEGPTIRRDPWDFVEEDS